MWGIGPPEARELFTQSKAIDSQHTGGYRGLARCAVARGQLDQAIEQLNAALKIDGKAAKNWIQLADIEVMRSNLAAAEKAYAQALKVAPEDPATHLAIAAFQIRQGNAKVAEKHLDEIKDKFGGNDLGWHSLKALLAFQQNRLEEADTHIGQILRFAPGHIPTQLLAGLTNYGLGRHEQAMGQLSKVLAFAPNLRPARIILSSIKLKQGQVKKCAGNPSLCALSVAPGSTCQTAIKKSSGSRLAPLNCASRNLAGMTEYNSPSQK